MLCAVLDASQCNRINNVPGHSDDKDIAEPLIEEKFRGTRNQNR